MKNPDAGNAGRFLNSGEIERVVGVEDQDLMKAANPLKTGRFQIDEEAQEHREDHIVRTMLNSNDRIMILLCGKEHDLSNNISECVSYERFE